MYNMMTIASCVLKLAKEESYGITHLKLLKMLCLFQGWYLAVYNKPLFKEDIIKKDGSIIIPALFEILKHNGNSIIKLIPFSNETINDNDYIFIDKMWKLYKDRDGVALSNICREKYFNFDIKDDSVVSIDLITHSFKNKLKTVDNIREIV